MPERQLAAREFQYRVTIPPGTPSFAPQLDTLLIDSGVMLSCELQVPSGHVGLTGFSLVLAGTTIVPWAQGLQFIVAEDARLTIPLGIEVDIGLQTACYNTDVFEHSFYLRIALADYPPRPVELENPGPARVTAAGLGTFTVPAPTFTGPASS